TIFLTGASGFIGRHLSKALLARQHTLRALVRAGSESKIVPGCIPIIGNPLQKESYIAHIKPADTFVHLVGVSHPSPLKAKAFRAIDGLSVQVAVQAAQETSIRHFVYLSVASPAPIMQSYIQVRLKGEALLKSSGLNVTFVKPWYV